MGLFDSFQHLTDKAEQAMNASKPNGMQTQEIVFDALPETLEQFKALPQAAMSTPFHTAALTVLALCFYPQNSELSLEMLEFLRGPRPLSPMDKSFIKDRFRDADYVPRSYFKGATPQNDYQPSQPYTVKVGENPYSYANENYAKLFLFSGGADNPREVTLRHAKDGKWYLWEQFILVGIRQPESANPWL